MSSIVKAGACSNLLVSLFGLSLIFLSSASFADQVSVPHSGFWINAGTDSGISQKSGKSASISGQICKIWIHSDQAQPKCHVINSKHLDIRAYFPDATNEVTNQVVLNWTKKDVKFSYSTPNLTTTNANVFTILIGEESAPMHSLRVVQAKIERRIVALASKLLELKLQSADAKRIAGVKAVHDLLQQVHNRISAKLSSQASVIAEYRLPLQVDNKVAAPSYYSSIVGGFLFAFSFGIGSAIEGQATEASVAITNYRHVPASSFLVSEDLFGQFSDEGSFQAKAHEDHALWSAQFYWNGSSIKKIGPSAIAKGETVRYSFPISGLSSENANLLEASVFRVDPETKNDSVL